MSAEAPPTYGLIRFSLCVVSATLGPAVGFGIFYPSVWMEPMFWGAALVFGSMIGSPVGLLVWLGATIAVRKGLPSAGPKIWAQDAIRLFVITGGIAALGSYASIRGFAG